MMRVDARGAIQIRMCFSQRQRGGGAFNTGAGDDLQGDAGFALNIFAEDAARLLRLREAWPETFMGLGGDPALTRASRVGGETPLRLDLVRFAPQHGDLMLLCTARTEAGRRRLARWRFGLRWTTGG